MIIVATLSARAQMSEPRMNGVIATSSTRFLPCMSASRPRIGVATDPVRRVTVMIHDTFVGVVWKISGRAPMIGTTKVCASDTTIPVAARTPTMRPGWGAGFFASSGGVSSVPVFPTAVMYATYT